MCSQLERWCVYHRRRASPPAEASSVDHSNLLRGYLKYDVDLPPSSETVVSIRIQSQPGEMVWGLVEPDEDFQVKCLDGLLVG